jgi:hypothetical protein
VAGLLITACSLISVTAEGQEKFFAIKGPGLWELDRSTGAELSWEWNGPLFWGWTPAFTSLSGTLLNIGSAAGCSSLRVFSINPADASVSLFDCLGYNLVDIIEADPTTGILYNIHQNKLHTMDPVSGQLTYIGDISGMQAGTTNLAIRHDGVAFCVTPGRFLATLDLTSGVLTPVGTVQLPIPAPLTFGLFFDTAFDMHGQLWGAWWVGNTGPTGVAYNGLYKIDMTTRVGVRMQAFNEKLAIAFVPDCTCATYCVGKPNGLGCVPTIARDGLPSPTAQSGFEISASNLVNQSLGVLAWSAGGRVTNPFQGGTWCVRAPLVRTPLRSSGGSPAPALDCSGRWSLDFNTYMQSIAAPPPGTTINCQWYGRDPSLAPPQNVQLSDALEFVLLP